MSKNMVNKDLFYIDIFFIMKMMFENYILLTDRENAKFLHINVLTFSALWDNRSLPKLLKFCF